MAKLLTCRCCVVELVQVELADGTAALVCVDCDAIGLAHEVARGAPMWPAGLSPRCAGRGQAAVAPAHEEARGRRWLMSSPPSKSAHSSRTHVDAQAAKYPAVAGDLRAIAQLVRPEWGSAR